MNLQSEHRLASVFVELTKALVDDFDVVEFSHLLAKRCAPIMGVDVAAFMLGDARSRLRLLATSEERPPVVELFDAAAEEGPCVLGYRDGKRMTVADLAEHEHRWPRLGRHAERVGIGAMQVLPLRLRDATIGVLTLLRRAPGEFDPELTQIAQAVANMATVGLVNERILLQHFHTEQLQGALTNRVIIEQAKGILAERRGVTTDDAFEVLRGLARTTNEKLSTVAAYIVNHQGGQDDRSG